jgi:hypothetical protein
MHHYYIHLESLDKIFFFFYQNDDSFYFFIFCYVDSTKFELNLIMLTKQLQTGLV